MSEHKNHTHDTRVDGAVKVKKRKKRKKHLFKLSAMNQLVDENSFLKNKYDKLSAGAEEKLGYHWNEVVQNILFNKYVKPDETLMGRYLEIKRRDEAEHDAKDRASHPASAEQAAPEPKAEKGKHEHDPPVEPLPAPVVDPAAPVDTRITTESTDTFSAGNYQHSGPLVTTKGGMGAFMRHWESKIKKDKSGMTIIQENNMVKNAFKQLNESGNPLANPALMNMLFESEFPGTEEVKTDNPVTDEDGESGEVDGDCRSEAGITSGLVDSLISISRILAHRDLNDPEVIEALKDLKGDEDIHAVMTALDNMKKSKDENSEETEDGVEAAPKKKPSFAPAKEKSDAPKPFEKKEGSGETEEEESEEEGDDVSEGSGSGDNERKAPKITGKSLYESALEEGPSAMNRHLANQNPGATPEQMVQGKRDLRNQMQNGRPEAGTQGDAARNQNIAAQATRDLAATKQNTANTNAHWSNRVYVDNASGRYYWTDRQNKPTSTQLTPDEIKKYQMVLTKAQSNVTNASNHAHSLHEGEAKPAALVQLDRLHKETEKASNGYYKKEQKERGLDMKKMADGSTQQQHDFDKDSMEHKDVPMHHPTPEEDKYVKLNRGGNLADRAIQGIKDMPKSFLDRMKDEAGADVVKDAQDKAKEIEKVKPALAPAMRVQTVNEGVVLTARYQTPIKSQIIAFNTAKAEKINALNENFTRLETKGFGNDSTPGAKSIIAENDFFIDLGSNQFYMLEKQPGMINESVQIKKAEYDRLRKLIAYDPSKWSGAK